MQEDDRPRGEASEGAPYDRVGTGTGPVTRVGAPEHRGEPSLGQAAHEAGVLVSLWGPDAGHRPTGLGRQERPRPVHLDRQASLAEASEVEVVPGVAADTVAGGRDAPDEIGRRRRLPAEHEERGGHVIVRQHIEHPRGEDGVRAIVERKSHNLVRRSHLAPRQITNATHRHESTRGPLTALHDRAGHRERRRSRMLRERMGVLRGACRRPGEGWSRGLRVPAARLAAGHQR